MRAATDFLLALAMFVFAAAVCLVAFAVIRVEHRVDDLERAPKLVTEVTR